MTSMTRPELRLIEVARLRPLEGHGPKRVLWLRDKILSEGVWRVPLCVEASRHLVMDGHHRFEVARLLGLSRVPAHVFTYDMVEVYSLRPNIPVSPEIIFANDDAGVLFPYKTAKHRFPEIKDTFEGIALNALKD